MKKYILILVIVSALIFTGCYGLQTEPRPMGVSPTPMATMLPNRPQITENKTYTDSPTNAQDAMDSFTFDEPYALIDDTELTVILEGVESGQEDKINFLFHVGSTSKNSYKMYIDGVSINNYMIPDCITYFDLNPGDNKDVNYNIDFRSVLENYGVENISDIKFHYLVVDNASNEVKYSDTAQLNSGVKAKNDYFAMDTLIGSNDYMDVYFVNAYSAYETDEYYELLIHNKGTETMQISIDAIAINGISIPVNMNQIILPDSYYLHNGKVSVSETAFMKNINKAASINLQISAQYVENESEIFSSSFEMIADEGVVNEVPKSTQVILSEDDVLISVGKLHSGEEVFALVIYMQNDSSEIYDFSLSDIMFNSHPVGTNVNVSVMPNTYAYRVMNISGELPDADYEMELSYEYSKMYDSSSKNNTVTFTLEK